MPKSKKKKKSRRLHGVSDMKWFIKNPPFKRDEIDKHLKFGEIHGYDIGSSSRPSSES